MSITDLIKKVADSTPEQQQTIARILDGISAPVGDTRTISPIEAARMLGKKSAETARRYAAAGLIKSVPTPSGQKRILVQSVHDYLDGKTVATNPPPSRSRKQNSANK